MDVIEVATPLPDVAGTYYRYSICLKLLRKDLETCLLTVEWPERSSATRAGELVASMMALIVPFLEESNNPIIVDGTSQRSFGVLLRELAQLNNLNGVSAAIEAIESLELFRPDSGVPFAISAVQAVALADGLLLSHPLTHIMVDFQELLRHRLQLIVFLMGRGIPKSSFFAISNFFPKRIWLAEMTKEKASILSVLKSFGQAIVGDIADQSRKEALLRILSAIKADVRQGNLVNVSKRASDLYYTAQHTLCDHMATVRYSRENPPRLEAVFGATSEAYVLGWHTCYENMTHARDSIEELLCYPTISDDPEAFKLASKLQDFFDKLLCCGSILDLSVCASRTFGSNIRDLALQLTCHLLSAINLEKLSGLLKEHDSYLEPKFQPRRLPRRISEFLRKALKSSYQQSETGHDFLKPVIQFALDQCYESSPDASGPTYDAIEAVCKVYLLASQVESQLTVLRDFELSRYLALRYGVVLMNLKEFFCYVIGSEPPYTWSFFILCDFSHQLARIPDPLGCRLANLRIALAAWTSVLTAGSLSTMEKIEFRRSGEEVAKLVEDLPLTLAKAIVDCTHRTSDEELEDTEYETASLEDCKDSATEVQTSQVNPDLRFPVDVTKKDVPDSVSSQGHGFRQCLRLCCSTS